MTEGGEDVDRDEKGFFLMDILALCCLLAAVAGCLGAYRMSAQMRLGMAMRTTAIYLAEAQLGYLEEMAWHGHLGEDEYPWQGISEDLHQHGRDFNVRAVVKERQPNICRVEARAKWEAGGREEEISLERLIRTDD